MTYFIAVIVGILIAIWGIKDKKSWAAIAVGSFACIYLFSGSYPYSSLDDFKSKLDGNTYIFDGKHNDGYWYKVVINGNKVTIYIASPSKGSWGEPYTTLTGEYKVKRFGDTGTQYYALEFGMWELSCPFENSTKYMDNRLINAGGLYFSDSGSIMYKMRKGDVNPWD